MRRGTRLLSEVTSQADDDCFLLPRGLRGAETREREKTLALEVRCSVIRQAVCRPGWSTVCRALGLKRAGRCVLGPPDATRSRPCLPPVSEPVLSVIRTTPSSSSMPGLRAVPGETLAVLGTCWGALLRGTESFLLECVQAALRRPRPLPALSSRDNHCCQS